ncbi:Sec-independent protein translocase protein TatB [Acinetobacter pragensis]|uniref:Sec-independent protein translocase protein TatB n=1 Tax=Acinetobacter pragensis TaxID=1806892 RepID=A0A151Y4R3_9GAMM|nr:Sec-independent protein translocase protein TatB [Acinetobacter pragensis]KYQ72947.1 twin arginine-targeting protein translocase TatB [Acinetobacter pragensis]
MLNIGMTELLCFAIIALLVLGPEKLPEGARFAAKWYGKFKRLISSVQTEIDRELRLSEFREEVQKEIERITELERRMQQQIDALRSNQAAPSDQAQTDDANTAPTETAHADPMPAAVAEHHYQHVDAPALTPYSCSHIQQHLHRLWAVIEYPNPPVNLKIAV